MLDPMYVSRKLKKVITLSQVIGGHVWQTKRYRPWLFCGLLGN